MKQTVDRNGDSVKRWKLAYYEGPTGVSDGHCQDLYLAHPDPDSDRRLDLGVDLYVGESASLTTGEVSHDLYVCVEFGSEVMAHIRLQLPAPEEMPGIHAYAVKREQRERLEDSI